MSGLYTASEAREKLGGIAPTSLQRLVDAGKIRKIVPPENKKRGLYIKEDVDKLAEAMQDFIELHALSPKTDKFEVSQAKNEGEIRATAQIARQHFGDLAYSAEERIAWFRKVRVGDYVLKHNGVIVGYFSVQAVSRDALEDHIFKPNGGGVQLDDIQPFTPGKPLDCYVTGMATKLGVDHKSNRQYGMLLLMGLFDDLLELGKQGIDIRHIWTKSRTVSGIKLCRDFGFSELGYIDSEHIGFMLDLEKSTSPLVQKYREVLKTVDLEEQEKALLGH